MTHAAHAILPAAVGRFAALAPLDPEEQALLHDAARETRRVSARCEVLGEGEPIGNAQILLSGWACRTQTLSDGRRQIIGVLLPGDLIGMCPQHQPVSISAVLALTNLVLCRAPSPCDRPEGHGLRQAYALSGALDQAYLFRHVTRLGRLSAYERTVDWLLELRERLGLAGLVQGDRFAMPMTQEVLADTLGLTSVHVNRTLQTLRREGVIASSGGHVVLRDPQRLAGLVDRRPVQVMF